MPQIDLVPKPVGVLFQLWKLVLRVAGGARSRVLRSVGLLGCPTSPLFLAPMWLDIADRGFGQHGQTAFPESRGFRRRTCR